MSEPIHTLTEQWGTSSQQTNHNADYQAFEKLIAERVAAARGPLFTTDATGLFEAYLAGIPGETRDSTAHAQVGQHVVVHSGPRQWLNCRHCRRFIEWYGGLVSIEPDGTLQSPIWATSQKGASAAEIQSTPEFFMRSICNITAKVFSAKVTGVFVNGETTWGTPFNIAGKGSKCEGARWSHLHGTPLGHLMNIPKGMNAVQVMAEKKQDYILLKRTLAKVPMEAAVQAIRVLESDEVSRAEKVIGPAKWFLDLHQRIDGLGHVRDRRRDNLVWLAVAQAPPGFCHVKNGVLGQLMDWIIAGEDFRTIQRKWAALMHPLAYQRSQAVPTDGQIEAANKLMAKLGAEGALERRYATLADVLKFEWRPQPVDLDDSAENAENHTKAGRTFDHLRQKPSAVKAVELPSREMSWEKFRNDILLGLGYQTIKPARTIEVLLTGSAQSFYGLVTAVNRESPPMLQWDGLTEVHQDGAYGGKPLVRNPTSWYFYNGGSTSAQWGIIRSEERRYDDARSGWWQEVDAIFLPPHQWQHPEQFAHHGEQVHFAISAANDQREAGGGYFPETLRTEYRAIRGVIEEHSKRSKLSGKEQGNANGIALCKGMTLTVRVDGGDCYVLIL